MPDRAYLRAIAGMMLRVWANHERSKIRRTRMITFARLPLFSLARLREYRVGICWEIDTTSINEVGLDKVYSKCVAFNLNCPARKDIPWFAAT